MKSIMAVARCVRPAAACRRASSRGLWPFSAPEQMPRPCPDRRRSVRRPDRPAAASPARGTGAQEAGSRCQRLEGGFGEGEKWRIGDVRRNVGKHRQTHRLESQISWVSQRQRRDDEGGRRGAGSAPSCPPNHAASGAKQKQRDQRQGHGAAKRGERRRRVKGAKSPQQDRQNRHSRGENREPSAPKRDFRPGLGRKMTSHRFKRLA